MGRAGFNGSIGVGTSNEKVLIPNTSRLACMHDGQDHGHYPVIEVGGQRATGVKDCIERVIYGSLVAEGKERMHAGHVILYVCRDGIARRKRYTGIIDQAQLASACRKDEPRIGEESREPIIVAGGRIDRTKSMSTTEEKLGFVDDIQIPKIRHNVIDVTRLLTLRGFGLDRVDNGKLAASLGLARRIQSSGICARV